MRKLKIRMKPNLDIKHLYIEKYMTMREIASLLGISAMAVCKRLKKAGISTHETVRFKCTFCGKQGSKHRSKIKGRKNIFCGVDCSAEYRSKSRLKNWHRLAKIELKKFIHVHDNYFIDFKDGNEKNSNITNLRVFKSEKDYKRFKRGIKVEAIYES